MDLEFISSQSEHRYASEFLRHMGDLQNIPFTKDMLFTEVIECLKLKNTKEDKINAIIEWVELNNIPDDVKAEDVFGLTSGIATFNFR